MEKIEFLPVGAKEPVWFFVLEETRVNGVSYLLVTESEEEDKDTEAEAYIMKDTSSDGELEAVSKIFSELLEDVDLRS